MSWSASGKITDPDAVEWPINFIPQVGNGADESIAQCAAAIEAVRSLIASGVIGAGPYALSMGGHANDGHGDVAGWSNDMVSINLSRAAEGKE